MIGPPENAEVARGEVRRSIEGEKNDGPSPGENLWDSPQKQGGKGSSA